MGNHPTIVLELPADARFLVVARSVAAGVAAGLELPYDAVDDLRIAVDEAASLLLSLPAPATRLTLHLRPDRDAFRLSIFTDAASAAWPPDRTRGIPGLPWLIITRLVDEAVAEAGDGGPSIHLMRRTIASGSS